MSPAEGELLGQLIGAKRRLAARGWMPATSGNLSARISEKPLRFWISASSRDKEEEHPDDFMIVDEEGKPEAGQDLKPSAEVRVHAAVYKKTGAGAVFHVHSVYSALTSEQAFDHGGITFGELEILKGLGRWEEGATVRVPIVPNLHDLNALADQVARMLNPDVPGLLIRSHGLYSWGRTCFEAKRHVEAFEFLCQWTIVKQTMRS